MSKKQVCAIALGSNAYPDIQESVDLVDLAISHLSSYALNPIEISNFYRTTAFPNPSDPDFVNAVVIAKSKSTPEEIHDILQDIEEKMGRKRENRWGQRVIDLDLLFVDQIVLPDQETIKSWIDLPLEQQIQQTPEELILPHPRIQDRAFVLVPLCDVASEWVHPIFGKPATLLKSDLNPKNIEDVRLLRET